MTRFSDAVYFTVNDESIMEMIAAAVRTWEQALIEEALGEDAAVMLPEAIRLVESAA